MISSGVMVDMLLALFDVLFEVSSVQNTTSSSTVLYCSSIYDQKAVSPGVQEFGKVLVGVEPPINIQSALKLASEGYSNLLQQLIADFDSGKRKWIKQGEVFMIQLLDSVVAVPIGVFYLQSSGDHKDVEERIQLVMSIRVISV